MAISTAELTVRLLVYLFVLIGVPLWFVLMFRLMDYAAHDTLVEQFSGQRNGRDTGRSRHSDSRSRRNERLCAQSNPHLHGRRMP
ncbi:hypothetical protein C9J85_08840 [Haloferax sp. wsp5]|nr:hypothetical protein C9J85_08840 [Haloferax sp. wsp5]